MYILDTNVVSELMKPVPHQNVLNWAEKQSITDIFLTAITVAELETGIALLPVGKRRQALFDGFKQYIQTIGLEHILAFDQLSATVYASIFVNRQKAGLHCSQLDMMIAAITKQHNKTLVTRNMKDFIDCDVELLNPWE